MLDVLAEPRRQLSQVAAGYDPGVMVDAMSSVGCSEALNRSDSRRGAFHSTTVAKKLTRPNETQTLLPRSLLANVAEGSVHLHDHRYVFRRKKRSVRSTASRCCFDFALLCHVMTISPRPRHVQLFLVIEVVLRV